MHTELMEKLIFISKLLLMLIFISCYPSRMDIVGVYVREYKPGYGKLILNQDSTFKYYLNLELLGADTFEGIWQLNKNIVNLNVTKPKIMKYENTNDTFIESIDYRSNNSKFIIFMDDSIPILRAQIMINDDAYVTNTDERGVASYNNVIKIKTISISMPGYQEYIYKIKNNKSNNFKCYLYSTEWIPYLHRDFPFYWKVYQNKIYKRGDKSIYYYKVP